MFVLTFSPLGEKVNTNMALIHRQVKKSTLGKIVNNHHKIRHSLLALCQNIIFSGREVRRLFMLPCTHTIPSLSTQVTKDGKMLKVKINP